MYLAVESLTVAFFSLIDDIKTSLQQQICRTIEYNYLVTALILTSHFEQDDGQNCSKKRVYQLDLSEIQKKLLYISLE